MGTFGFVINSSRLVFYLFVSRVAEADDEEEENMANGTEKPGNLAFNGSDKDMFINKTAAISASKLPPLPGKGMTNNGYMDDSSPNVVVNVERGDNSNFTGNMVFLYIVIQFSLHELDTLNPFNLVARC